MRADELKVGMELEGWTIVRVETAGEPARETCPVLLTLMRKGAAYERREWFWEDEEVDEVY